MKKMLPVAFAVALLLIASSVAHAQWVLIGKKSMAAIRNLRSENTDVATVILEAPVDKVYSAAVNALNAKEGVKITKQDDAARTLDFSNGKLAAKMKISRIEVKVSMITVASAGSVLKEGETSMVVDGILKVCKQMGVKCELSNE